MQHDDSGADPKALILSFAAHVGRGHTTGAETVARQRNWLSDAGDVTEDGNDLVRALNDQTATRTVFRGNF